MAAFASLASAIGALWVRLAPRDVALEAVPLIGPDPRKEAGTPPATGTAQPLASPPLRGWVP